MVVCDETGLAASLATIDELASDVTVDALIEVTDAASELPLDTDRDIDITWVHRGMAQPGTTPILQEAFEAAVSSVDDRTGFFDAGESRGMAAIRRYIRRDLDVPADRVSITGYWRHR